MSQISELGDNSVTEVVNAPANAVSTWESNAETSSDVCMSFQQSANDFNDSANGQLKKAGGYDETVTVVEGACEAIDFVVGSDDN